MMLRIVIADDHPVVLKGLKEILSESFDEVIIDETLPQTQPSLVDLLTASPASTSQERSPVVKGLPPAFLYLWGVLKVEVPLVPALFDKLNGF
jgi:hypothetical protein